MKTCIMFSTVQARDSDEPTRQQTLLKQLPLFPRHKQNMQVQFLDVLGSL